MALTELWVMEKQATRDGASPGVAKNVIIRKFDPALNSVGSIGPIGGVTIGSEINQATKVQSTGLLKRSSDGNYVTFLGFNLVDSATIPTSFTTDPTQLIVARVSAPGGIADVSTILPNSPSPDYATALGGAVTDSGTNLWVVGSTQSTKYTTLGSTTNASTINASGLTAPTIFNGNLYVATTNSVLQYTGTPTSSSTPTALTFSPAIGALRIVDFYFASSTVMYVIVCGGGGITGFILRRYDDVAGTWTLAGYNYTPGGTNRILSLVADGTDVYITEEQAGVFSVAKYSDTGSAFSLVSGPVLSNGGAGDFEFQGAAMGDPHFYGYNGEHFDFHGEPNKCFNLFSDINVQINALFKHLTRSDNPNDTIMTEMGIKFGDVKIKIDAKDKTVSLNNEVIENISLGLGCSIRVMEQLPEKWEHTRGQLGFAIFLKGVEIKFWDYEFFIAFASDMDGISPDFLNIMHNIPQDVVSHGIIGQTAMYKGEPRISEGRQGEGIVEGHYLDYEVSSLFADDFKYNKWNQPEQMLVA